MGFGLKLSSPPAVEPVSATEAKRRLAIVVDDDDDDVEAIIAECRALAESECRRAFITQTWTLYLDGFPCGSHEIPLPRPPLSAVNSVKYYDADGTLTTLSSALYHVATGGEPGRVVLKSGESWPLTELGRPESVQIEYLAGYGPAGDDVPAMARAAILIMVADRYENPGNAEGECPIPPAARRALDTLEDGTQW